MAYPKCIFKTMSSKEFKKLIQESSSVSNVLGKFGYSKSSGTMQKIIKDRILEEKIDISHFKRNGTQGGQPRYSLEEILVENSNYTNIARLKKRLLSANLLEYKCMECGNIGEWNGKPLVLQLEHKNGIHNDHRLCNIGFLCPNCHSQTDTYSGKNANKNKIWTNIS